MNYQMPTQPPMPNQYQQWQTQAAFTKSFTTPAIITLVLYLFLWVPGLIANIVYLVEADKVRRITGVEPDGYGCLLWLLFVVVVLPLAISFLVGVLIMLGIFHLQ